MKRFGLKALLEIEGLTFEEMAENSLMDGTCPGICRRCGYTTEVEPDQGRGWCEECEANTVVSGLVLAGLI
jgi:hypothetical protein